MFLDDHAGWQCLRKPLPSSTQHQLKAQVHDFKLSKNVTHLSPSVDFLKFDDDVNGHRSPQNPRSQCDVIVSINTIIAMGIMEFIAGLGLANRMRPDRQLSNGGQCSDPTAFQLDYFERLMEQQVRTHESFIYQKNLHVEALQQAMDRLSVQRDLHAEDLQLTIRRLVMFIVVFSVIGESTCKENVFCAETSRAPDNSLDA